MAAGNFVLFVPEFAFCYNLFTDSACGVHTSGAHVHVSHDKILYIHVCWSAVD